MPRKAPHDKRPWISPSGWFYPDVPFTIPTYPYLPPGPEFWAAKDAAIAAAKALKSPPKCRKLTLHLSEKDKEERRVDKELCRQLVLTLKRQKEEEKRVNRKLGRRMLRTVKRAREADEPLRRPLKMTLRRARFLECALTEPL